MCLEIRSSKCFLYCEGNLIAYKIFEVIEQGGKVRLGSLAMKSKYKFVIAKELELMIAIQNDKKQKVQSTVIVKNRNNYKEWLVENLEIPLGFHSNLFEKNQSIENCFELFKFTNVPYDLDKKFITLPVIIGQRDIQLIGEQVVSKEFAIPSYKLYHRICLEYQIEPSKEILKFLKKLFESYS